MPRDETRSQGPAGPLGEPLTRRERDVLALLAQGYSGPEIADKLTLGLSSVKSHIQHLYGKLGVNSKRQAVARARELGLLESDQPLSPTVPAPVATIALRARHNLPRQITRLFGRERDVDKLKALVREQALVTLTGSGGVGKTRLSLAVAEALLEDFRDGVWLVELAAMADPALVPHQAANALSVRDDPSRTVQENLAAHLRERECLLILDNCEHLLEACSELVSALLRDCSRLRILASSREPLAAYGEAVFRVPSLPFPEAPQLVAGAGDFAAVRLFVDRARLVQPDYQLTDGNAAAIARICERLDGIPLAIEMAAARVNLFTAEQLAGRLDDAFRLLTVGSRTALARQKTLRATIDWSYQLLTDAERLLLNRLSVFAGGCTLEAAEAVCSGDGLEASEILDALSSLVAKSVVIARREPGREARYGLLETIRQYGWEKLSSSQQSALQTRHLDYFLKIAEEAEPELKGPHQVAWLARLFAELANLRAAMDHSRFDPKSEIKGQRLLLALMIFWDARVNFREVHDWLAQALVRLAAPGDPVLRARLREAAAVRAYKPDEQAHSRSEVEASIRVFCEAGPSGRPYRGYALMSLADIAHREDDYAGVVALLEEAISLFREQGDKWGLAWALNRLGSTRDPLVNYLPRPAGGQRPPLPNLPPAARNDHSSEMAMLEESLRLFREIGDRFSEIQVLGNMGVSALCWGRRELGRACLDGVEAKERELATIEHNAAILVFRGNDALADDDLSRASTSYAESLQIRQELQMEAGMAWMYDHLAEVARRQGDFERAAKLLSDALILQKEFGTRIGVANALDVQGRAANSMGDAVRALSLHLEAFALRLESGHPIYLAYSFHGLAVVAAAGRNKGRAARLFGAARPYHSALFFYWSVAPIWGAEHERALAAVREQIGAAQTERLMAEGEALSLEQAVAFALDDAAE